jgi:RecQ family ATP-dependent DNA helicase
MSVSFIDRASALVDRLDAGESLDAELDSLRVDWRRLAPSERERARHVVEALGARTRTKPVPRSLPAPRLFGEDEQADAQRALHGIGRPLSDVAQRYYEGPPDPEQLLEHLGLQAFRPGQREAVSAALEGRDSLVIMPTGGGKSLCYTLPGLASDALTVVVSPLIALMSDQYRRLAGDGHPAVMIASALTEDEHRHALQRIRSGSARIVFCSPERFGSRSFLEALGSRRIALFAVDEAHCVSEWGHDFRPDYLRLHGALARLGRPPVMACTATATPAVAAEIAERLDLREPLIVQGGFDRPNLSFDVLNFEGQGSVELRFETMAAILSDAASLPAIVYAGTRADVETLSERLRERGLNAVGYHAGMDADERASAQHRFLSGDAEVVVATNAFGMGVDKANVRTVIHHTIPSSIEAYYQEAGRAGRDGEPARAVLLASRADLGRLIRFNSQRSTSVESVVSYLQRLRNAAAGDDQLTIGLPREDDERTALAVAERAGAVTLAPAGGGRLQLAFTGALDRRRAHQICQVAKDRGWSAYRAIETFVSGRDACRRRQILDHFGDSSSGPPTARCCDVCDPPDWLPEVRPASRRRRAGAAGPSGSANAPALSIADLGAADQRLYQALAGWRKQTAAGKPAYTVASNATLALIATRRPSDLGDLQAVRGVGPAFIATHGAAVLEIVASAP